jgi:dihydroorotase/N-acyl-D-amino-acid deacylase
LSVEQLSKQRPEDLKQLAVLKGGTVLDGTGSDGFQADVLIAGERIEYIGQVSVPVDAQVFGCAGLVVSPGFIDAHSHSDLQVLEPRLEKVRQGVTTEVVGNCGFSPYPAQTPRHDLYEFANGIFCGDASWGWDSAADYLAETQASSTLNVASLVGHGTLRIWKAGMQQGALPRKDVDAMCGKLSECLEEGACGLSTGLMYAPGSSSPFEELEALCRVIARHGKIYATHMRNYSDNLVEAVDEQIELARRTGCRLQISHLQAVGKRNWHLQAKALHHIERARNEGMDVGFDAYPYVRGSTVLTQVLPQWALDGGTEALIARLKDEQTRNRIGAEANAELAQGWENIIISAVASSQNASAVGRNLADIGETRGREPVKAAMDLLIEEHGQVNILEINQSEENLRQSLTHACCNVISDGFYVKGKPHPRLYGTFPYFLGEVSRDRGWLPLAEAVHKVTELPARRFGIQRRGRIEKGYIADITVFDAATVNSPATYDSPDRFPTGIEHVFRGGVRIAGERAAHT